MADAMAGIQDDTKDEPASVPLMVVENGCGSPCIDFRQVSSELAAAAKDADLLILEGMGRSLHTNLNACFKCDALKAKYYQVICLMYFFSTLLICLMYDDKLDWQLSSKMMLREVLQLSSYYVYNLRLATFFQDAWLL
ncbi:hypothetical protein ZWY2020_011865 [Hordeum vulgare]|nr:hypothetical protein ZWY2020_011865 [Hordeum vulgare]